MPTKDTRRTKQAVRRQYIRGARMSNRAQYNRTTRKMRKIHSFKRQLFRPITYNNATPLIGANGTTPTTVLTNGVFTLNQLPNYTEFTNLFDQYRIMAVKIKFVCGCNTNAIAGNATSLPNLYWVKDYDDGTCINNIQSMCEYENFQMRRMDKPISIYIRHPKNATTVYAGGAFSGYEQNKRQEWVDCTSPNVEYYGIKYFIDPVFNPAATIPIDIFYTFYIQCKDVK